MPSTPCVLPKVTPKRYPPNYQRNYPCNLRPTKANSWRRWLPAWLGDHHRWRGNIEGGQWNPPPSDGTLWFDTRQGRLFVWAGWFLSNEWQMACRSRQLSSQWRLQDTCGTTLITSHCIFGTVTLVIVSTELLIHLLWELKHIEFKMNRPFLLIPTT